MQFVTVTILDGPIMKAGIRLKDDVLIDLELYVLLKACYPDDPREA